MKTGIVYICLMATALFSCNKSVELQYIEPIQDTKTPDYNILFEASRPSLVFNDEQLVYESEVNLYLRPYENVSLNDNVIVEIKSNKSARFVLHNDTLYSGDKTNIKFSEFKNFIYHFEYQTRDTGEHSVSISTTIRGVTKDANFNISTQ